MKLPHALKCPYCNGLINMKSILSVINTYRGKTMTDKKRKAITENLKRAREQKEKKWLLENKLM